MALRRQPAEVQLAAARKRLVEQQASLARSAGIVERADGEKDAIALRENAGEISAEQAAKAFAEVQEQEVRHRGEVDRIGRVIRHLEAEIVQLEGAVDLSAYEEAVAALRAEQAARLGCSKNFATCERSLVDRQMRLVRSRAREAELLAGARELQPDGADDPPVVDEDAWLDPGELVAFLKDGPRQPVGQAQAAAAKRAADHEKAEREEVRVAVRDRLAGGPVLGELAFERLAAHLHEEARAEVDRQLKKHGMAPSRGPERLVLEEGEEVAESPARSAA